MFEKSKLVKEVDRATFLGHAFMDHAESSKLRGEREIKFTRPNNITYM